MMPEGSGTSWKHSRPLKTRKKIKIQEKPQKPKNLPPSLLSSSAGLTSISRLRAVYREFLGLSLYFYFFIGFLGVWSGSMTFLTLLASFLILELLRTVGWRPFRIDFRPFWKSRVPNFPTLFEKVDPIRPLRPKCSVENDPILILSL